MLLLHWINCKKSRGETIRQMKRKSLQFFSLDIILFSNLPSFSTIIILVSLIQLIFLPTLKFYNKSKTKKCVQIISLIKRKYLTLKEKNKGSARILWSFLKLFSYLLIKFWDLFIILEFFFVYHKLL